MDVEDETVGKEKYKAVWKKWWIIFVGLLAAMLVIILGVIDSQSFPDEKYISAAAFIMLISTAILQNRELSYQRQDVELNRQALIQQGEELQSHTEEFRRTNQYNKENLEITQFFGIFSLREEIYFAIVKDESLKITIDLLEYYAIDGMNGREKENFFKNNYIEQFNLFVILRIKQEVDKKGIVSEDELKENVNEFINDDILTKLDIEVPSLLLKLHRYNVITENLVYEKSEPKSKLGLSSMRMSEIMRNMFTIPSKRFQRKDLYELILTDEEKLLNKIIKNDIEYEDIKNLI